MQLSSFLAGETDWAALTRGLELLNSPRVDVRLNCEMIQIDRIKQRILDSEGCTQTYSRIDGVRFLQTAAGGTGGEQCRAHTGTDGNTVEHHRDGGIAVCAADVLFIGLIVAGGVSSVVIAHEHRLSPLTARCRNWQCTAACGSMRRRCG